MLKPLNDEVHSRRRPHSNPSRLLDLETRDRSILKVDQKVVQYDLDLDEG